MHNIPMETFVHELSGPHCSYFEHLSVAEEVLAHFCLLTGVFFCEAGCLAAASTSHYLTDLQGFFMRLFGMYRTGQETE